jgi:preprotein translocase subunit SecB
MTDTTKQPGIIVERVAVRTIHFEHTGTTQAPTPLSDRLDILLTVEQGASADSARIVAGLRSPTENSGPYKFEIVMEAVVREDQKSRNLSAIEYARSYGWALLFPFIRERLVDLSGRAFAGQYVLPPTNVMAVVKAHETQPPISAT